MHAKANHCNLEKRQIRNRVQADKKGKKRLVEEKKEKRIASFLGKERESVKMDIPPLSCSFRSTSFVNPEVIQGNGEK